MKKFNEILKLSIRVYIVIINHKIIDNNNDVNNTVVILLYNVVDNYKL